MKNTKKKEKKCDKKVLKDNDLSQVQGGMAADLRDRIQAAKRDGNDTSEMQEELDDVESQIKGREETGHMMAVGALRGYSRK